MKKFLLLALVIFGCTTEESGTAPDAVSCTVIQEEDGAIIKCPDGTSATVKNGSDGTSTTSAAGAATSGEDGADGEDGTSCSVAQVAEGAVITCGSTSATVYNGTDGASGQNCTATQLLSGVSLTCGSNTVTLDHGADGADGAGCAVAQTLTGAAITCGSTTALLSNGAPGADGAVGPAGAAGPEGPAGEDGVGFDPAKLYEVFDGISKSDASADNPAVATAYCNGVDYLIACECTAENWQMHGTSSTQAEDVSHADASPIGCLCSTPYPNVGLYARARCYPAD